jgi:hypothetical protein
MTVTTSSKIERLQCDMDRSCTEPVTHLEDKGYVYCTGHADCRRGLHRIRKLRPYEIRKLLQGDLLKRY